MGDCHVLGGGCDCGEERVCTAHEVVLRSLYHAPSTGPHTDTLFKEVVKVYSTNRTFFSWVKRVWPARLQCMVRATIATLAVPVCTGSNSVGVSLLV